MSVSLREDEKAIVGAWVMTSRGIAKDEACERIEALVRDALVHVSDHPTEGAWLSLFRDPADGRLWERWYPQGEMHGGGPPALRIIPAAEAKAVYPC